MFKIRSPAFYQLASLIDTAFSEVDVLKALLCKDFNGLNSVELLGNKLFLSDITNSFRWMLT